MWRTTLLAVVALTASLANPTEVGAAFPGANGKIAFASQRVGPYAEIWVMDANGSNVTRLTFTANQYEVGPEWSPSGTRIAFYRGLAGNDDIWVMDQDGSNQVQITNNVVPELDPDWSPDGKRIVYRDGGGDIYTVNSDGTGSDQNLTNSPGIVDISPSWSPNGDRISFASDRDAGPEPCGDPVPFCHLEIYTMKPDGSDATRLTYNLADDRNPDWSPDGQKIVFDRSFMGLPDIYVMDADGSNLTQLTNDPARDAYPSWSPDGTKIVFYSTRDSDDPEIYVMDANGDNEVRLTTSSDTDTTPDWQKVPGSSPHGLAVSKAGTGDGTVSSSPAGITCGLDCSQFFPTGAEVTLTATPNETSTFTGWSGGGCSGTGTCQVTMDAAKTVTAEFTAIVLTVVKIGSGGGTVISNPPGIDCGIDCSETYSTGTVVTLAATPTPTSSFTGWSGSGCSGTGTCLITMDTAKSVSAMFVLDSISPVPPVPKTVTLSAKPRRLEEGERTRLKAIVSPCSGHEGDLVHFYRGHKRIATKTTNDECIAKKRVRARRTSTFRAISPQQDSDHLAGFSNRVKVRVR